MIRAANIMFFFVPGIVVIMLTLLGCLYLDGPKWALSKPILPPSPIVRENGALVESRPSE